MIRVRITRGAHTGRIGILLDRIPRTEWYNVLIWVVGGMRLALRDDEWEYL
jgi:hypothetical protein